jgi:hypothetical protein
MSSVFFILIIFSLSSIPTYYTCSSPVLAPCLPSPDHVYSLITNQTSGSLVHLTNKHANSIFPPYPNKCGLSCLFFPCSPSFPLPLLGMWLPSLSIFCHSPHTSATSLRNKQHYPLPNNYYYMAFILHQDHSTCSTLTNKTKVIQH